MLNVFEGIPYNAASLGKRALVDQGHLKLMQIALEPGQAVPDHQANSNVHLLVLAGQLDVELDNAHTQLRKGDLIPVALGTPMSIRNNSEERSTFLVLKTPNPAEIAS